MINKVKQLKIAAMKARNSDLSGFWATVLGELQLADSKKPLDDETSLKIVRKMRKTAVENLEKHGIADAQGEIDLLDTILPQLPSVAEDTATILGLGMELNLSGHIGQLTGQVCKELKSKAIDINGGRVKLILTELIRLESLNGSEAE